MLIACPQPDIQKKDNRIDESAMLSFVFAELVPSSFPFKKHVAPPPKVKSEAMATTRDGDQLIQTKIPELLTGMFNIMLVLEKLNSF